MHVRSLMLLQAHNGAVRGKHGKDICCLVWLPQGTVFLQLLPRIICGRFFFGIPYGTVEPLLLLPLMVQQSAQTMMWHVPAKVATCIVAGVTEFYCDDYF